MKKLKKVISVILCIAMLISVVQVSAFAATERTVSSMPFVSVSDIHYFPESLMGNRSDEWFDFCRLDSKMYNESEQMIRTGFTTICERAKENGTKYILVPGDLTRYSEYEAHSQLAKIMQEYQDEYGVQFLVINGNHDINCDKAVTFENDTEEQGRAITPEEFVEVYKNMGYGDAVERFGYPENGDKKAGELSYIYELDDHYNLIVVDSCIYEFDKPGKDTTGGKIGDELMNWIEKWANKTHDEGKEVILMMHHGAAAHMEVEPSITFAFPVDEYYKVADKFASMGINFVYTGHLHTNDVSSVTNDDGQTVYDFESDSITGYPAMFRENVISTKASGISSVYTNLVDFDAVQKMTFDGVTYDNGTYKKRAFDLCFGGGLNEEEKANTADFLLGIVKSYAGRYIKQINEAGGILEFLKSMDIDLEEIIANFLKPYIGDGFKLGGYNIFSVDNIMWFVEDLCGQVSDLYLKDPQKLYDVVGGILDELMSMEVSDKPCTKYIDSLGFGSADRKGTLGEVVLTAMANWYNGNETIDDDPFMQDVVKNLESGVLCEKLFNKLIDLIMNDLLDDAILSKLEIRVDKLLNDKGLQKKMGEGINYLLSYVLKGNFSYGNLVDTIFALGVLPYNNLYDLLDKVLISKYLTFSQFEGTGTFIAYVLKDFSTDSNPTVKGDYDVTYTNEVTTAPATQKNFRLPTMLSVTMGEDSTTQATINWFSKYSLEDTDIEIYKADSEPQFKGESTTTSEFTIDKTEKTVVRSYPGIDVGVAGFLKYEFDLVQHTVKLSNLEPGATYYYRVGNAKYGWWSNTGKVTTADGSDNVTFFHMTDPQSQNDKQYTRAWKTVLKTAFEEYPDAKFVLTTGDLVDHGDNNKLWQSMFDMGADSLMNTYLMPVTGNHEGMGTNATANYFVLPNMPEQDTSTGVYYSFDYNNIHVAVLNTEKLNDDDSLSDDQIEWLTKDMQSSDAQWKFVALHKALYSHGSHYKDDDVVAMRAQLGDLLPKLGVDMVFEGHDHVYMRTASLINNVKEDGKTTYLSKDGGVYKTLVQPNGTVYEIGGCSGVKTYITNDLSVTDKYFPRAEKALAVDAPMFSAIRIEDGVLYFDAYVVKDDGAVSVDRFAIQKDTAQGEVVPDYKEPEEQDNTQNANSFLTVMFDYIIKVFRVVWRVFSIYIVGIDVGHIIGKK